MFGLLALAGRALPVGLLAGCVGAFALFHGFAHGAEMPGTASGLAYGLGFPAATALLHAVGLGLGVASGMLAASRAQADPGGVRHRRIG